MFCRFVLGLSGRRKHIDGRESFRAICFTFQGREHKTRVRHDMLDIFEQSVEVRRVARLDKFLHYLGGEDDVEP